MSKRPLWGQKEKTHFNRFRLFSFKPHISQEWDFLASPFVKMEVLSFPCSFLMCNFRFVLPVMKTSHTGQFRPYAGRPGPSFFTRWDSLSAREWLRHEITNQSWRIFRIHIKRTSRTKQRSQTNLQWLNSTGLVHKCLDVQELYSRQHLTPPWRLWQPAPLQQLRRQLEVQNPTDVMMLRKCHFQRDSRHSFRPNAHGHCCVLQFHLSCSCAGSACFAVELKTNRCSTVFICLSLENGSTIGLGAARFQFSKSKWKKNLRHFPRSPVGLPRSPTDRERNAFISLTCVAMVNTKRLTEGCWKHTQDSAPLSVRGQKTPEFGYVHIWRLCKLNQWRYGIPCPFFIFFSLRGKTCSQTKKMLSHWTARAATPRKDVDFAQFYDVDKELVHIDTDTMMYTARLGHCVDASCEN